ncbi:beta-ketoacyl-ACP synthase III [Tepidimonas charontis]|uniref:Beta-ketoacyl-[acyl-carrier-protein] synthase III n=1 Tax=Tepidimonas charontis TaxID=2267262 RepID=A0A554XJN4_9BURK|nr:beta-ketoacyl-ACP synthase III [Tepidimonas charontis]TSE36035.1 3-oxoacyl-acyl-carrier-protein synthase 3 [Tepidimonas charontis]
MSLYARITGTGSALPPKRLTNEDMVSLLAARGLQTSDDWIVERTGIRARHFVEGDTQASDLALTASLRALQAAGRQPHEVDLIVVATSTPDMVFPSTATIVQRKLHEAAQAHGGQGPIGAPAFDLQAVCTGFIYALTVADALIRTGSARCALVVGAEVFSRILDFDDRTTCVLFGDGAGAVVLEATEHDGRGAGVLATDVHADGRHTGILCVPGTVAGGHVLGEPLLRMDGQAVFKLAVGVLEETARTTLAKAGLSEADIDWLIPHQANIRIMQSTARKLKLPMERVVVTVDQHGNTSAASIPLALDHAVRAGMVRPGQLLLLEGVGGGFTWGSALVRY